MSEYKIYYVWINDPRAEVNNIFWHYLGWNKDHAVYWTSTEIHQSPSDDYLFIDEPFKDHIKIWSSRDIDEYHKSQKIKEFSKLEIKYNEMIWDLERNNKGKVKIINDINKPCYYDEEVGKYIYPQYITLVSTAPVCSNSTHGTRL